jgi:hypothetical protein
MGWMIQDFKPERKWRYLSLLQNIQNGYGAHAASYSVDKMGFFQTVKWQWCEADNSLHLM